MLASGMSSAWLLERTVPFFLTNLACVLAWSAEYWDDDSMNRYSSYLVIVAGVLAVASGRLAIPRRFIVPIYCLYGMLTSMVLFNILVGRDATGSGGLYGLCIVCLVYLMFIAADGIDRFDSYRKQIGFIYSVHVLYIFAETVAIHTVGIRYVSELIPFYRYIPGQPIYQFLNMENPGSPNGMFVGAQVASQMLVLAMVWYAPIYSQPCGRSRIKWQFVLATLLFPFSMTGTSVVMLAAMLGVSVFFFPRRVLAAPVVGARGYLILSIAVLAVFYDLPKLLLYRVADPGKLDLYFRIFADPVRAYLNLPAWDQIVGMQADLSLINHADFGWAILLWNNGLVVTAMTLAVLSALLLGLARSVQDCARLEGIDARYLVIASMLAVQVLGWLISQVHYYVAIEHGGKEILGLLVAMTAMCYVNLARATSPGRAAPTGGF